MFKKLFVATALAATTMAGAPARASTYTDDLGKCLVSRTSAADKLALIKWVFVAMAASPAVKDLSAVTPAEREANTKVAAALMVRLLSVDCRAETVAAIKYDGPGAVQASFSLLGQVAMRELVSDPAVSTVFSHLGEVADIKALGQVFAEAGIVTPPPK